MPKCTTSCILEIGFYTFYAYNHVVTNFRITFGVSIFPDVGKDWAVIRQSFDVSTFEISAHSDTV